MFITVVCVRVCVRSRSILIFLCLCLPALNRLGVETRLMLGPSKHSPCSSAFICLLSFHLLLLSYCLSGFYYFTLSPHVRLSVYLPVFSSSFLQAPHSVSPLSSPSHSLFATSFLFMCGWWMLMNLWISAWGALFRGRPK